MGKKRKIHQITDNPSEYLELSQVVRAWVGSMMTVTYKDIKSQ